MKKWATMGVLVFLALALPAFAMEDPVTTQVKGAVDTFVQGCQEELTTFCKDVSPGEGRILACLYAFEDKLSPRCDYALYDSVNQLKKTVADLSYVVEGCRDDLTTYCADIQPGEGRLLDCLKKNDSKVSAQCNTALKDVGYVK